MKRKTPQRVRTTAERRRDAALECARLLAVHVPDQLEAVAACVMRVAAAAALELRFGSHAARVLTSARLFTGPWPLWSDATFEAAIAAAFRDLRDAFETPVDPHEIGCIYESLIGAGRRKQSGSFFTPPELARAVVEATLGGKLAGAPADVSLRVCDPALGAGAFLLEAGAVLSRTGGPGSAQRVVEQCLFGVDRNALAVAVAEIGLWLFAGAPELDATALGQHLLAEDALELDWRAAFPQVFRDGGFDVVLGNPPWVAFAGRAAQALEPERRARYARFRSFRGYPTLHALFVERAAELTPCGTIGLLLPSPVSDLDGYRAVRSTLTATHRPREPLMEYGQDAFRSVTQPCFALIADAGAGLASDRPWRLVERQRARSEARAVDAPDELLRLLEAEPLPPALFGEMGFQTSRVVSQTLLLRAAAPDERHRYPLLEGRNVREFHEGPPGLFLCADPESLRNAGCRLRPEQAYRRVAFVVRQTASYPIAALHGGLPFRNTLLAGFSHDELPPELIVGLLNSTLYRGLHLAARRDARQAVFPQVKVSHLRSLPRPRDDLPRQRRVAELARRATDRGPTPELRAELDRLVYELFGLHESVQRRVADFVADRLRPAARVPSGDVPRVAGDAI